MSPLPQKQDSRTRFPPKGLLNVFAEGPVDESAVDKCPVPLTHRNSQVNNSCLIIIKGEKKVFVFVSVDENSKKKKRFKKQKDLLVKLSLRI